VTYLQIAVLLEAF